MQLEVHRLRLAIKARAASIQSLTIRRKPHGVHTDRLRTSRVQRTKSAAAPVLALAKAVIADRRRGHSCGASTRMVRASFSSLSIPPLVRPSRQRPQRLRKPLPFVRQSIASLGMLDKAGLSQFSESRVEQSRVGFASVLQGPEGQRVRPKFPKHAQRSAPSQQVQSDHDGAAGGGTANWSADTRRRHALLYTARSLRWLGNRIRSSHARTHRASNTAIW